MLRPFFLLCSLYAVIACSILCMHNIDTQKLTQPQIFLHKKEKKQIKQALPAITTPLSLGQLRRKYSDHFYTNGTPKKEVALTFDDAPDPRYTPQVLDILKKYNVRATFFVVGTHATYYPELMKRIINEGHIIGNHSYDHPQFSKISIQQFESQVNKTNEIIKKTIGYTPRFIRPPYGSVTEDQLRWGAQKAYTFVNWDVDSLDWKGLSKEKVSCNILDAVKPGSIILQHAGGGKKSTLNGSVQALPTIITTLRNKGYVLVTLDRLLGLPKNK